MTYILELAIDKMSILSRKYGCFKDKEAIQVFNTVSSFK